MASKRSFYWDACMFYEVLGDEPVSAQKRAGVQDVLTDNKADKNVIFTSIITHLEVLPRKLAMKDVDDDREYLALFDGSRFVEQEINRNVLLRAREIRDYYYRPAGPEGTGAKMMDAADAIHLATASVYQAAEFHTRDDDKKGVKVPLLSLYDWSGNDKLCGKYHLPIVSPETPQGILSLEDKAHTPER